MKKISLIVPVWNVENYIEDCLKSLVNQTLEDIEIIVVNDGSPDNSQKIIEFPRISEEKKNPPFYYNNTRRSLPQIFMQLCLLP